MELFKTSGLFFFFILIILSCSKNEKVSENSSDSEIKVLETKIERKNDEKHTKDLFEVRLLLPVSEKDFLRIDKENTKLTKATDDSGIDLLKVHEKEQQKTVGKWWHDPSIITGNGKHPREQGVWVDIALKAAPADDADKVTLSGKLILQFDTGETKTDTLADLPLKMDLEKDGVETKIGKILIYGTGAVDTEDTRYWSYNVDGNADILSVEVLGNDDTQRMQESTGGRGASSTGFAFIESTELETVTLKVKTRIIRNEEVPFELTLDVE